jgi:serine/threonine protein kinase
MTIGPGTQFGHYEVIEPIGAGGMGEVYRARDTELERDVAIKVLP